MKALPKYVNDKRVLNAFNIGFWEGITEKRFAQSQVLDFFENALMGSAISEKVAT